VRLKTASLTAAEIAFVRALVIHEDAEILALNKPAGLSSQGGDRGVNSLDELLGAFAKASGVRPRLIHRLDRGTSGVILTAKSQPAAATLGKAMMGRRFRKTYLAILAGVPSRREGVIDAALLRVEKGRESFVRLAKAGEAGAQNAQTRYRTLAEAPRAALVELSPITGRMHQLRVHLASLGLPIAGDPRYGGALVLAGAPVPRLMLHAAALEFPHPATGVRLRIEASMPEDMRAVMAAAGLSGAAGLGFHQAPLAPSRAPRA
jgi:tRNA pseudouridine32 synthase/23S rRNA pseudouridine746 synthase